MEGGLDFFGGQVMMDWDFIRKTSPTKKGDDIYSPLGAPVIPCEEKVFKGLTHNPKPRLRKGPLEPMGVTYIYIYIE